MRHGAWSADGDPFAVQIFGLLDFRTGDQSIVQIVSEVGDADEIASPSSGIEESPRSYRDHVDFTN